MQAAGILDLPGIQTAVFEYNGKLPILPVSRQRPVAPGDMDPAPEQELMFADLIMDGRIQEDNFQRMGLDPAWLESS